MFKKILIANRGEIACRVIETAHKMGIECVAVYSEADTHAMHVEMADEAFCIGPAPSKDSYLRGEKIIEVALAAGAQAIHPGYGFLSENAQFAGLCESNNIVFIAPPASAIEAMGSKSAAKQIMEAADVPLVPGYHGDDQDPALIHQAALDMGYPVLLKAAAGGGGKGMRVVWSDDEFDEALGAAKREALNAFGDDKMLVEKYLTRPRHVEIQVFTDTLGNGVYLFERDCSIQRRHQKVLEEAPAPGMTEQLRDAMGTAALKAARAINYVGAGTVEFLLDEDDSFYFMEMNTRLQVEHPVTEMITGQDLVEWQLRVANGEPLPLAQEDLEIHGHSLEVRIYAEDPDNDFLPSTGDIRFLQTPETSAVVRVDTGVRQGDTVSVYYDPMIAKLIVWGENRDAAIRQMQQALKAYRLAGLTTNLALLQNIVNSQAFGAADLDTGFIDKHEAELFPAPQAPQQDLAMGVAAIYHSLNLARQTTTAPRDPHSLWNQRNHWAAIDKGLSDHRFVSSDRECEIKLTQTTEQDFTLSLNGQAPLTVVAQLTGSLLSLTIEGRRSECQVIAIEQDYHVYLEGKHTLVERILPDLGEAHDDEHSGYEAPMNGTLIAIEVAPGETVKKDQTLVIMEAMKMEHTIRAHADGVVDAIYFGVGDLVAAHDILLDLSESAS